MFEVTVLINSIDRVKDFVNLVNTQDYDIDLTSERYIIDAKSIMGIFSLDLSKPQKLIAHTTDEIAFEEFRKSIREYLV